MSKIALSGNSLGTGTFTIASPNSNTDRTLNLPDAAGTILTSASTASFPAGTVIQVVQNASAVGLVTTTSTSYVDLTNATATITPRSASNKILVLWTARVLNTLVSSVNVGYFHRVLRSSTALAETQFGAESGSGGLQIRQASAFSILDAPNTTSAVTYKIQHSVNNASSTGSTSSGFLTLLEIAG